MSSVSIRLIRNDNAASDDLIIVKRDDDYISVKYTDRQCNHTVVNRLTLHSTGLSQYIQNMGYLFMRDTDPFRQMQFNFPGFPTFLTTRESISNIDTQNALMEIADIVNDSWFAGECGECV